MEFRLGDQWIKRGLAVFSLGMPDYLITDRLQGRAIARGHLIAFSMSWLATEFPSLLVFGRPLVWQRFLPPRIRLVSHEVGRYVEIGATPRIWCYLGRLSEIKVLSEPIPARRSQSHCPGWLWGPRERLPALEVAS